MEKHSMPALPDWPDRDVQTRFSPAAIPQPAPPPDTGPTVQWPTPRRSRRALLAGVLLGLTGLSVAGAVIVSTCTLCYAVSTNGSPPLAYVQGEDTYQTAVRQVEDQVSEILRSDYRYAQETTMALTIAPKNSLQTSDQLTASLMETVDQVKAEYILTIDGLPIGACESREATTRPCKESKIPTPTSSPCPPILTTPWTWWWAISPPKRKFWAPRLWQSA